MGLWADLTARRRRPRITDVLQATITDLRAENAALRAALLEKDRHFATLVERVAAPAAPPVVRALTPPPEVVAQQRMDEVIARMAKDFETHDGMAPADAIAHARELAAMAEAAVGI